MYDSTADTLDHIGKVRARIEELRADLARRAEGHDASKLREPEKSGYDALGTALQGVAYGSDEYRAALAANAPTVAHHYAANTHHPEHHPNGIAGMSLLDVVEMLCDWKAASERGGPSALELGRNTARFGISEQLAAILANTVRELGW